jgi:hypothetical protein
MERIATTAIEGDWGRADPGDTVLLGFRANHDPAAFEAPGELRLAAVPTRTWASGPDRTPASGCSWPA